MNAFIQQHTSLITQIKEYLVFFYGVVMFIFFLVAFIEMKLYFNLDVIPGADIPIDEWYVQIFK